MTGTRDPLDGRPLGVSGPLADPETMLLQRERLACALAALPALTEKERVVLRGVLNGKSHRQLAADHGLTRKAVSLALRRARDKLDPPDALAA
jgi:DNA-directed RNA polymerase specialized sigma24 family protein